MREPCAAIFHDVSSSIHSMRGCDGRASGRGQPGVAEVFSVAPQPPERPRFVASLFMCPDVGQHSLWVFPSWLLTLCRLRVLNFPKITMNLLTLTHVFLFVLVMPLLGFILPANVLTKRIHQPLHADSACNVPIRSNILRSDLFCY